MNKEWIVNKQIAVMAKTPREALAKASIEGITIQMTVGPRPPKPPAQKVPQQTTQTGIK